ncbi:MAG: tail fiber domain-containing protein [Beijerinckiaceae bacterium]
MGSKQTSTSRADPWGPTQGALKGIVGDAGAMYADGGFRVDPYAGNWVAGQTGDTTAGQSGLRGLIPQMSQYNAQAAGNVAGMLGQGPSQAQIDNMTARIMPSINSSFAGSGMTGSSLHAQNLAKGLGQGMGELEMANRDQQARLSGQLQGMSAGMADPYKMQMGLGADQQGYDQKVIDAAMQKDVMGQTADMSALQQYAQLISGIGGQFGSQTSTQKSGMGLGGMLGLGLQGISMFSDMRLKEDVRRIGVADNGLPLYAYRYKGSDAVHVGVMAQEVAQVFPEAVSTSGGFLKVDYGAVF